MSVTVCIVRNVCVSPTLVVCAVMKTLFSQYVSDDRSILYNKVWTNNGLEQGIAVTVKGLRSHTPRSEARVSRVGIWGTVCGEGLHQIN